MTDALLFAKVTTILRHHLENGLVHTGVLDVVGGEATISALPPDRIQTGAEEKAQLNLFLYRVGPAEGRRRASQLGSSGTALGGTTPPFDLYYVITAYGHKEIEIELLLGYVMQLLREIPCLDWKQTRMALESSRDQSALATANAGSSPFSLELAPQFLSSEELSKLWAMLQTRFRPSLVCRVTLDFPTMADDGENTPAVAPVSRRGHRGRGE